MAETVKDIATWIGVGFNQWLKQSNILLKINAYLLAAKAIVVEFAEYFGYVQEAEEGASDPLAGMVDSWEGINSQVDAYKNKLLGFDKFQSLSTSETGDGADITEAVKKAMEQYQGILDGVKNISLEGDAERGIKGAYEILELMGFELDKDGKIVGGFDTLVENAKTFAKVLGTCLFFIGLFTNPFLAIGAAIEYIWLTNEDFRNSLKEIGAQIMPKIQEIMEALAPMWDTIAGFVLDVVNALLPLIPPIVDIMKNLAPSFSDALKVILSMFSIIISTLADLFKPLLEVIERVSAFLGWVSPLVSSLFSVIGLGVSSIGEAVTKIGTSLLTLLETLFNWSWGELGGKMASIWSSWNFVEESGVLFEMVDKIPPEIVDFILNMNKTQGMGMSYYADGGLATKGSLFYAGEAGPELVTQTSGGGSTIMNMKQLEDAVARGFIRGFASTDNGYDDSNSTEVYVDGQRLFDIMRGTAKRNGYDFVRV
jgi:hypothetical protein